MLTMSLDRIVELLEKAAEVDVPAAAIPEDEADSIDVELVEALDDALADDPAYQALTEAVEGLAPQELLELTALGLLARNDAEIDEWEPMIEQARAMPENDTLDMLIGMLLLTDDIEVALDRLGYLDERSEAAAGEDESAGEEEEEDAGEDEHEDEEDEGEEGEEAAERREKTAD